MSTYSVNEKIAAWLEVLREKISQVSKDRLVLEGKGLEYFLISKNHANKKVINIEFADLDDEQDITKLREGTKFHILIITLMDSYHYPVHDIKHELEKLAKELFGKDFDGLIIKN